MHFFFFIKGDRVVTGRQIIDFFDEIVIRQLDSPNTHRRFSFSSGSLLWGNVRKMPW